MSSEGDAGPLRLLVLLPGGDSIHHQVSPDTPMLDLLVQLSCRANARPTAVTLEAPSSDQPHADLLPYKPSTRVGALGTQVLRLVHKSASRTEPASSVAKVSHSASFSNRVQDFNRLSGTSAVAIANDPDGFTKLSQDTRRIRSRSNFITSTLPPPVEGANQKNTFRLQVHLPRDQLHVIRAAPTDTVGSMLDILRDERSLRLHRYTVHSTHEPHVELDPDKSLRDYNITEMTLRLKPEFDTPTPQPRPVSLHKNNSSHFASAFKSFFHGLKPATRWSSVTELRPQPHPTPHAEPYRQPDFRQPDYIQPDYNTHTRSDFRQPAKPKAPVRKRTQAPPPPSRQTPSESSCESGGEGGHGGSAPATLPRRRPELSAVGEPLPRLRRGVSELAVNKPLYPARRKRLAPKPPVPAQLAEEQPISKSDATVAPAIDQQVNGMSKVDAPDVQTPIVNQDKVPYAIVERPTHVDHVSDDTPNFRDAIDMSKILHNDSTHFLKVEEREPIQAEEVESNDRRTPLEVQNSSEESFETVTDAIISSVSEREAAGEDNNTNEESAMAFLDNVIDEAQPAQEDSNVTSEETKIASKAFESDDDTIDFVKNYDEPPEMNIETADSTFVSTESTAGTKSHIHNREENIVEKEAVVNTPKAPGRDVLNVDRVDCHAPVRSIMVVDIDIESPSAPPSPLSHMNVRAQVHGVPQAEVDKREDVIMKQEITDATQNQEKKYCQIEDKKEVVQNKDKNDFVHKKDLESIKKQEQAVIMRQEKQEVVMRQDHEAHRTQDVASQPASNPRVVSAPLLAKNPVRSVVSNGKTSEVASKPTVDQLLQQITKLKNRKREEEERKEFRRQVSEPAASAKAWSPPAFSLTSWKDEPRTNTNERSRTNITPALAATLPRLFTKQTLSEPIAEPPKVSHIMPIIVAEKQKNLPTIINVVEKRSAQLNGHKTSKNESRDDRDTESHYKNRNFDSRNHAYDTLVSKRRESFDKNPKDNDDVDKRQEFDQKRQSPDRNKESFDQNRRLFEQKWRQSDIKRQESFKIRDVVDSKSAVDSEWQPCWRLVRDASEQLQRQRNGDESKRRQNGNLPQGQNDSEQPPQRQNGTELPQRRQNGSRQPMQFQLGAWSDKKKEERDPSIVREIDQVAVWSSTY